MKRLLSLLLMSWALLALSLAGVAQQDSQEPPPEDQAPPRSDVESSSKDSKVDLSAPSNDTQGGVADDVLEFRSYNPHKALKNIEVGDYYFKRQNYRAALSRYREALAWKPSDAEATLRMGRVLEKLGEVDEARENYQEYLKILPKGEGALEAHKALERLDKPAEKTTSSSAKKK